MVQLTSFKFIFVVMNFKQYIYIIPLLLSTVLSSCVQDLLPVSENTFEQGNVMEEEHDISLMVDAPSSRTRAVDFTETASIRINQVWLGIFNVSNGKLEKSFTKTLDYRTIQSNEEQTGLLRVNVGKTDDSADINNKYIMVCLANIKGVTDSNGNDIEEELENLWGRNDSETSDWEAFNSIAVDCASAYSDLHNTTTPVLAGFLYKRQPNVYLETTHIKIDQFAESQKPNSREIMMSPSYRVDQVKFGLDNENNFDIYGVDTNGNKNYILKLRRLVANINVNINLTPLAQKNLTLTDVSYKRYNMPKGVYIIERRTTDCTDIQENGTYIPGKFAPVDNPGLSPNWADLNPSDNYYNDTDWQFGNITGFSFQHFANKHWARFDEALWDEESLQNLNVQKKRERRERYAQDSNGENLYYYHALVAANKEREDFNNYASYFVVKMHLIDKNTSRALEAEYTIHEGYCSDELGNPVNWEPFRAKGPNETDEVYYQEKARYEQNIEGVKSDFVVARNINYTYNIYINGVDDIYYNVESSQDYSDHNNGQGGKVWKIYYASDHTDIDGNSYDNDEEDDRLEVGNCSYDNNSGSFKGEVPYTGGYYKNAIYINNENPDIAFRLYGYTFEKDEEGNEKEGSINGYNYNFPQESFQYLKSLWPPSAGSYSHYFLNYEELQEHGNEIPEQLLKGLTIYKADQNKDIEKGMNIVEFVKYVHDKTGLVQEYFDIEIKESDIGKKDARVKNNYVRAIYIADRKGQPDNVDGCTRLVNIFAAAQYPELDDSQKDPIKLTVPNMNQLNLEGEYYYIIDQYLPEIRIPLLKLGIPREDYSYKLTIDGEDYSDLNEFDEGSEEYVYKIPMYRFINSNITRCNIRLQVLPVEDKKDAYVESSSVNIGYLTLRNHNIWKKGDKEDWDGVLSEVPTVKGLFTYKGKYLTFKNENADSNGIAKSGDNIKFNTNTAYIIFRVYRPCIITINGPHNDSTAEKRYGINMTLTGNVSGSYNNETQYFNNSNTLNFEIDKAKFGNNEYIEVELWRASATGTDVTSVLITPSTR